MQEILYKCGINNNLAPADLDTFCGLPHHLYLPRSREGPGQNFELLAFVNDVDPDVTEGRDGVEHM